MKHVLDDPGLCDAPCLSAAKPGGCTVEGRRCLVEAATLGDRCAQELLFSHLYPSVLSQARRLCSQGGDAEDLAQLSLLAAFRKIGQLRDRSRLRWWTREIVRNAHLMSLRRRRSAPLHGEETILQSLEIIGPGCGADHDLEVREAIDSTFGSIRGLSPNLREVVELRIFQNKNTAQTAQRLRITRTAVRTRLKRAREALRQAVGGRHSILW